MSKNKPLISLFTGDIRDDLILLVPCVILNLAFSLKLSVQFACNSANFIEIMVCSQLAQDLARGEYFPPVVHGYGLQPLLFWALGLIVARCPKPATTFVILQIVLNSSMMPLIYFTGKKMFNRRVGALAALLAAVSLYYNFYAADTMALGAIVHAPGLYLLYTGLRRRSKSRLFWAGFAFGFFLGGVRYSPLFLATGALWIYWRNRRSIRIAAGYVAWMTAGFLITLIGLFTLIYLQPVILKMFASVFTSAGFMHLGPSASTLGEKLVETIAGFCQFDPLIALPFGLTVLAAITRLAKRRGFSDAESFLWLFAGSFALVITFVTTAVDPSPLLGINVRPIRYFSEFVPVVQLLSAYWIVTTVSRWRPNFFARWRSRLLWLPAALALLATIAAVAAPPVTADSKLTSDLEPRGAATVLSNWMPADLYRHYVTHDYSLPYREAFRRWRAHRGYFFPPIEFYVSQTFSGPAHIETRFGSRQVSFYCWYMNMPLFNLAKLETIGEPAGQPHDVYLYFLPKVEKSKRNFRYHEQNMWPQFLRAEDDWQAMRRVNPRVDWRPYLVRDDADGILLRLSLAPKTHRRLRLRFGIRERIDPQADFTVPASLQFLPELGFGWKTAINLVDRNSWNAEMARYASTDGDLLVLPTIGNDFIVRTPPGKYRVVWEWSIVSEEDKHPTFVLSGAESVEQQTRQVSSNRFQTAAIATWREGEMRFSLEAPKSFYIHAFTLEPAD